MWLCVEMYRLIYLIIVSLFSILQYAYCTHDNPDLDLEFLYKEGVNHYLDNRWDLCVRNLEFAIQDWHWWKENNARCRQECEKEKDSRKLMWEGAAMKDIVFEQMIYSTLCLVKCKKKIFGKDRMDKIPPEYLLDEFESMIPYDYLQLCYYQMTRFEDAANAAATVLAVQPHHEIMKSNLEYYIKVGNVDPEDVVDLELKEFVKKYYIADSKYQSEDYRGSTELMEEVLKLYFDEYRDCRALCETPFDQGWFPDYLSSLSNHFTFVLRCKNKCHRKLTTLHGTETKEFIPSVFNYLQFSYYKTDLLKKATEAVGTYLAFDPENAQQLRNKQFYSSLDGITEEYFTPRKEIVEYLARIDYETKLLIFIDTKFAKFDKERKGSKQLNENQSSNMDSLSSVISDFLDSSKNILLGDNKGHSREEL